MKRWVIPLSVVLMLALVGGAGYFGFHSARPAAEPPKPPPTTPVTRGDVRQTITGPGQTVCVQDTQLEMPVSGRLAEVKVRPGDSVKKGDVLARLDPTPLQNAVREATAQLEQSRFKLQKAQRAAQSGSELAAAGQAVQSAWLSVVNAQGVYSSTLLRSDVSADVQEAKFWADYWADDLGDKWQRLDERPNSDKRREEYEQAGARAARANNDMLKIQQDAQNQMTAARRGIASAQQAYLNALAAYESLKSGDPVKDAELEVLQDEVKLTKAQTDLAAATLAAPFDGVVLEVKAQAGETVAAGAAVVHLADPSALEVKATVVEEDLPLVQAGQPADLYFDALPDAQVKGRVSRIVPQREPGSSPLYPLYIKLDSVPAGLAPGMTADSSMIVASRSGVLRLPRALVRARADGTAQVKVWVDGQAQARTVKVGLRGDQYVEILDGLSEGEQVVSQ